MGNLNRLLKLMTSASMQKLSAFLMLLRQKGVIFMLLSLSVILLSGLALGQVCKKIHFPALFGMIVAGIIIGPHVLDFIDDKVLNISTELRKIALIIILIRAGLKLNVNDLKKVGRPAVLMCFLPACFEIVGMVLLAPPLLNISRLDAAILGAVVGAVSPAVIVPRMINLIDSGYGTDKGIPQMILAGASVDDVFVIVMFTTFTSLAKGESVSVMDFVNIPLSIIIGTAVGMLAGFLLYIWFEKIKVHDTVKIIMLLCISFLMTTAEDSLSLPFASLIAVMAMGLAVRQKNPQLAVNLSSGFDKLWIPAEILLFVLVGASVAVDSLKTAGITAIILILCVLVFRMLGVFLCVLGTKLNKKEQIFCMLAYTPKATVQAAIGGLPLAMGLSCGNIVLTVSVIAILLTAPLGAFAIDLTYTRFLNHTQNYQN